MILRIFRWCFGWFYKYIKYLGLYKEKLTQVTIDPYTSIGNETVAEKYLELVKGIETYQENRLTAIENKNSQLVGQASIVVSIFGLFIPLLINNLNDINIYIKIIIILAFLFIFGHYIVSIFHSTRTLVIQKYPYRVISTKTLTNLPRNENTLDFLNEQIKDLIGCIEINSRQNNRKGENLIFSVRAFRIANFGFVGFVLMILSLSFFLSSKPLDVNVKNLDRFTIHPKEVIKFENRSPMFPKDYINRLKLLESRIDSLSKIVNKRN